MKQQQSGGGVAAIHQTLIVLWVALIVSQLLFLMVVYFAKPEVFTFSRGPAETDSLPVIILLAAAGLVAVGISFVIRSRTSKMSEAAQKPEILQGGLITALALCEASSLFGLIAAFAFNYSYFYFWIFVGVVAAILHFPRLSEVLAATYRSESNNKNGI